MKEWMRDLVAALAVIALSVLVWSTVPVQAQTRAGSGSTVAESCDGR